MNEVIKPKISPVPSIIPTTENILTTLSLSLALEPGLPACPLWPSPPLALTSKAPFITSQKMSTENKEQSIFNRNLQSKLY